ncbi:MAG: DUF2905 domain-containing protein [Ignavibacteria bacterium]
MDIQSIGKFLLLIGLLLVVIGGVLMFVEKIPFLGRLPGDIRIERENFRFYFPIATSILLSIVVSVILWLISHFRK